jgi:hypothetical protein
MTNNLTTRLLLAVALVGTLAVPAQAASNLYKFARSTYLFSFYDHVCKPGSLSPNAKKLVELVTDNLPPDLKSRAINEIAETGKRYGPAYCTQLEHEIDVNGFNASAELPGVMQSAKVTWTNSSQKQSWRMLSKLNLISQRNRPAVVLVALSSAIVM